ncbi:MAG: C25 family cysteine peptidase [candidate division WOR-3 bacterium]
MKSCFLLIFSTAAALAGVVSVPLEISPVNVTLINKDTWTVVELKCPSPGTVVISTTEPGEPLLPVISGNVLIPADARLTAVRLKEVEWSQIAEEVRIYPVQPMRPLSRFNSAPFVEPKPAVYESDEGYPVEISQPVPEGSKSGFKIAGFLFCPFRYHPKSGRLFFARRVLLEIEYEKKLTPPPTLTSGQREVFQDYVQQLVINQTDVNRWAPVTKEFDGDELDVVIVTSATLASELSGLCHHLRKKGYFTEIIPTETVYTKYSGRDNPEKIRNMLKDKFNKQGLKYVILAGDVQYVPCRYGYLPNDPYDVPADLYYSDLDGTWDANNNSQFGEYYSYNFNPDSVDLYSDIIVGRLPFDNATNCTNFLHKDTLYELHPDTTYLNNCLLPFEALWSFIDYYGRIVNKNIATALSGSGTWLVDSMLDMSPSQCVARINSGRHLFHFAGHGSYDAFGATFSTSNLTSLTNTTKPCIVNSMACDCGNFDEYDCLGEQFINITNGGAVSTCLNARYGWGAPPTMGPSENLCMEFYKNYIKGMTQGRAYALAKDFYRNAAFSQMTYRWSLYDWTLQGDPTMVMWRTKPQLLSVICPDTIPAQPQVFTVEVYYPNSTPAPGARVAILHQNELIGRSITNSSGVAKVALPFVSDTWRLKLSVTCQDGAPYQKDIFTHTGSDKPLVVYHHHSVDDANGRLDPGEETDIYLVVTNKGNLLSLNTQGVLHSNSPYLTIIDSISNYGSIPPDDTARGDAYRLRVSKDCPQGAKLELLLNITGKAGMWESQFELTVGMPYARSGTWAIHDTGNFVIGVCANGGIGTTTWRGEGLGLIYPKSRAWSSSAMMHGSFLLGITTPDTCWVADNYYSIPWQFTPHDFAIVDSLRPVFPPELGNQEYRCVFSDANHPQPKGLTITQRSFVSALPRYNDFIVLEYRIHNNSSDTITNLWTGVACDFRTAPWNSDDIADYGGTDSARTLAYVKASPETLALGIRAIYPREVTGWANCINHNTYIGDGFTKSEKLRFLDGRLRSTTGNFLSNWHALVSSGPYTILPADSQIVAFALIGGRTVAEMKSSSDSALNWFEPPTAIENPKSQNRSPVYLVEITPHIFNRKITIRYQLTQTAPLTITIYDAAGRAIDRFEFHPTSLSGTLTWQPGKNQNGIFFIRFNDRQEKVVRIQ